MMSILFYILGQLVVYVGVEVCGDVDLLIQGLVILQEVGLVQLSFLVNLQYCKYLFESCVGVVLLMVVDVDGFVGIVLVVVNFYLVYVSLLYLFDCKLKVVVGIYFIVIVVVDVEVDLSVSVGVYVVIESGVCIGVGVSIGVYCVIGVCSVIGEGGWLVL